MNTEQHLRVLQHSPSKENILGYLQGQKEQAVKNLVTASDMHRIFRLQGEIDLIDRFTKALNNG